MAAQIQRLAQLCTTLFSNKPGNVITKERLQPLSNALNKIEAKHLDFDQEKIIKREKLLKEKGFQKAPVTYMPLKETDACTMCVFIMKREEGGSLPLHDHPGMHGLLKVISGQRKIRSYTVIDSEP